MEARIKARGRSFGEMDFNLMGLRMSATKTTTTKPAALGIMGFSCNLCNVTALWYRGLSEGCARLSSILPRDVSLSGFLGKFLIRKFHLGKFHLENSSYVVSELAGFARGRIEDSSFTGSPLLKQHSSG